MTPSKLNVFVEIDGVDYKITVNGTDTPDKLLDQVYVLTEQHPRVKYIQAFLTEYVSEGISGARPKTRKLKLPEQGEHQ